MDKLKILQSKTIQELFDFLSIPSISAKKENKKDIKKASFWLFKKFKSIGLNSKIFQTKGNPIVYAEKINNKERPTVLIYGHYDVQSPEPLEEWSSPPFQPEIRKGNIYARGSSDNKCQLYTWISAIEKTPQNLLPNIKFVVEGEEETGSENFETFIKKHKKLVKADICVISDSHCLSENQPLISYGLRGLAYFELQINTLSKDVHSGLYGGNVANPAIILCQLISKMKDENGYILIPHFYDRVRKLSPKEKKILKELPIKEEDIISETGALKVFGEKGFSIHERAGARPTLDVNGIWGGYIEEGQKTIIPASASVKISTRIVPNQKPSEIEKIFKSFVLKNTPKTAKVKIQTLSLSEPVIMNIENPFFRKAESALEKVFGKKPIYELSGGSIGAASVIKNKLGTDCILMGYGLPNDGLHAPNEKFSLKMLEKGIKTNIEFLKNVQ